jgi:hypothetical protein
MYDVEQKYLGDSDLDDFSSEEAIRNHFSEDSLKQRLGPTVDMAEAVEVFYDVLVQWYEIQEDVY